MSDKLLEQILFELRRNRVGALWGTNDIALFLNVSRSTIFRLIHQSPDFPKPIRLPSPGCKHGLGRRRWQRQDVVKWALRHRELEPVSMGTDTP